MEITNIFPRYDQAGQDLILKAYNIASEALKGQTRGNGERRNFGDRKAPRQGGTK